MNRQELARCPQKVVSLILAGSSTSLAEKLGIRTIPSRGPSSRSMTDSIFTAAPAVHGMRKGVSAR
jgi:hypothetical protein